jgi:hypothetical protein
VAEPGRPVAGVQGIRLRGVRDLDGLEVESPQSHPECMAARHRRRAVAAAVGHYDHLDREVGVLRRHRPEAVTDHRLLVVSRDDDRDAVAGRSAVHGGEEVS